MKKEIKAMLELGNQDKILKINEVFQLEARYIDSNGLNVELSKKEPNDVKIRLVFTGHTAGMLYYTSVEIVSRQYDTVVEEIKAAMETILDEIKETLTKNFLNGYIG